mgnify:FL=1
MAPTYVQRKREIFAPNHGHSGCKTARPTTCEKTSEIGHDPYCDTVENGSTLGKTAIHDTQLDPKAQNLTPNFWNFYSSQKARSDRLCRPL